MPLNRKQFFARIDSDSLSDSCAVCPTSRHCCYRVATIVVTEAERAAIVAKYGRGELFESQGDDLSVIHKAAGQPCPFLTVNETCGIYPDRPKDCRSWPITHQSPPLHGHFSVDWLCPDVEHSRVPPEFIESAVTTLQTIPLESVVRFAELVHQDEAVLLLVPVDIEISVRKEKK